MDGEELTEQETALYDRQIRVWGADAQRRYYAFRTCVCVWLCFVVMHVLIFWKLLLARLSKSHILVSGLKGSVIEVLISR